MDAGRELPNTPDGDRECKTIALTPSDPEAGSEGSEIGDEIFAVNEGGFLATCGQNSGHLPISTSRNIRPKALPALNHLGVRPDCSPSTGPASSQGPAFLLHCGEQFCTDAAIAWESGPDAQPPAKAAPQRKHRGGVFPSG
jgi:hypothetical protein